MDSLVALQPPQHYKASAVPSVTSSLGSTTAGTCRSLSLPSYSDIIDSALTDRMTTDDWIVFSGSDGSGDNGGEVVLRRPESMWLDYLYEWNPLAAEIEALDACEWLREAGFPQYVQMYKDGMFPIDLESVRKDHVFLEPDDLDALFRRLRTLEKSSRLKLKSSTLSATPLLSSAAPRQSVDDSDDDDLCALSDRWQYQRGNRQWSRLDLTQMSPVGPDDRDSGVISAGQPEMLQRQSSKSPSPCQQVRAADTLKSDSLTFRLNNVNSRLHVPLRASSSSPVPKPSSSGSYGSVTGSNGVKQHRSGSAGLSPTVTQSKSVEFQKENTLCRGSPSPKNVSSDIVGLSLAASGTGLTTTALSDSERSSGGSSTASISPGPAPRRATTERLRNGAWNIFKKVENHLMTKRSTHSNRRASDGGSDRPLQIGGPMMIESAEVRAKLESMRCVDIVTQQNDAVHSSTSGTNALTSSQVHPSFPVPPSPSLSADSATFVGSRKSCSPSPSMSSDASESSARRLRRTDGMTSLDTCCGEHHQNGHATTVQSATPQPLLSRRSQKQLLLNADTVHSVDSHRALTSSSSSSGGRSVGVSGSSDDATVARMSFYDNVTTSPSGHSHYSASHTRSATTVSEQSMMSDAERELDAILSSLYNDISWLSKTLDVVTEEQSDETDVTQGEAIECASRQSDQAWTRPYSVDDVAHVQNASASTSLLPGGASVVSCSEVDSPAESDSDRKEDDWSYPDEDKTQQRERRDSGVGSSLTRSSPSRKHCVPRIRWHSFARSHRPSVTSRDHQIASMSAGQLAVLHRICMLKVTAALEKYSPVHRSGRSWFVPRLMKRARTPDYSNRSVFGVPLSVIQQRHGQPLPQCILYAMRRLRRSAAESVGVFRKSGVRSRILGLRNEIEADPESVDFDNLSSYDVADLLKLYFRELPECLLTNKLSHVFVSIFLHVPVEKRLDMLKATVLLLPDSHRETLLSLLLFLSDVSKYADQNQMSAHNLAICFAPSLFHLCGCWKVGGSAESGGGSSSKRGSGQSGGRRNVEAGVLSDKDLAEQRASHECLTSMITSSKELFTVPQEMVDQCHLSYIELGNPVTLEELVEKHSRGEVKNHTAYVDSCIQGVLKESRDKFKGWVSVTSSDLGDVELAYKKVGDGHPLRLWKSCVEIEAPPIEVLDRVLRERHLWDDDMIKWRVVERLDSQTEVFQYVVNAMVPHPTRDFCELRSWRVNLPNGVCVLVSTSVEHKDAPLMGGVRAVTLASRYLIEPCGSGKSRLTHISRTDVRGRSPEWYNSDYGRWFTSYARRIRSSFRTNVASTVPETSL